MPHLLACNVEPSADESVQSQGLHADSDIFVVQRKLAVFLKCNSSQIGAFILAICILEQ